MAHVVSSDVAGPPESVSLQTVEFKDGRVLAFQKSADSNLMHPMRYPIQKP